ncbi:hypothetical protein AVEN_120231-1 [Araneus ventricosus]|uniref:Uncharacterized protein n=1 Tax=Araneus ventricosus TaxID=182803 RepID=A0A4Y2RMD3_ARAVE|nr:hypothetical protein AVEN_120231-1 [Araneus ventricosus]
MFPFFVSNISLACHSYPVFPIPEEVLPFFDFRHFSIACHLRFLCCHPAGGTILRFTNTSRLGNPFGLVTCVSNHNLLAFKHLSIASSLGSGFHPAGLTSNISRIALSLAFLCSILPVYILRFQAYRLRVIEFPGFILCGGPFFIITS